MFPHNHIIWRCVVGTAAYPMRIGGGKFIPANPAAVDLFVPRITGRTASFYFTAPIPDDEPVSVIRMDRLFELFEF